MSKPREFWIRTYESEYDCWETYTSNKKLDDADFTGALHVREVIEISEAEIMTALYRLSRDVVINGKEKDFDYGYSTAFDFSFKAGARWAIAKMRGGE